MDDTRRQLMRELEQKARPPAGAGRNSRCLISPLRQLPRRRKNKVSSLFGPRSAARADGGESRVVRHRRTVDRGARNNEQNLIPQAQAFGAPRTTND